MEFDVAITTPLVFKKTLAVVATERHLIGMFLWHKTKTECDISEDMQICVKLHDCDRDVSEENASLADR